MNLKLFFFCLFLAVLFIPADLKDKKDKKHPRRHYDEGTLLIWNDRLQKKRPMFKDIIKDSYFSIDDGAASDGDGNGDGDGDDDDDEDWLYKLQKPEGLCNPNPCLHNGVCEQKDKTKFKCDCPKPFKGMRCQTAKNNCRKGLCGRGECVLTSNHPFYECKCKEPFQPPDCRSYEYCDPNPCKNGGRCFLVGMDFHCLCPSGYKGNVCEVGPDDCYVEDGESYRGNVSEAEPGDECLYWNSHFILDSGTNPFTSFEDNDGLGPHNFCRNPDGDATPWCFFRRGRSLLWDYCDVRECSTPTDVSPTEIIPPVPDPTTAKPQPTKPEPTADIKPTTTQLPMTTKPPTTEKPSQAPQPSPVPTDGPTIPGSTVPPEQFSTCGQPQPEKPLTRIFGGLKVSPGALPWQVSLQVRPKDTDRDFRHICGGVLIASCWVLTAGHCIEQNKDMQVVIGGLSLDMPEYTEQTLRVEEAIVHENYTETPTAVYSDNALLRLKGTDGVCANETQFVKTACLPDAQLPDGTECTISGWGATDKAAYGSHHLLEANVLLINQDKCSERDIYGSALDDTMFCAGHLRGGVDSCQGDSGGPLTCKLNNTSVIYGLVSWGDQCGKKNKPGVYTRVTHFLDWIKSKTQATFPSATCHG